jgi:hypothetical protein
MSEIQETLIEYIIQDIIAYLMEDYNINWIEALKKFCVSEVFDKLNDIQTGLYLESSAYVYQLYQDEVKFGKIIQQEI